MRNHKSINKSFLDKIKCHVMKNINLYILSGVFIIIGIVAGVLFYNLIDEKIQEPVNDYIYSFIQNIKEGYEFDNNEMLKNTMINNTIFTVFLWFIGCTVIGLPIVYGCISFKGFSLGYTICTIIGVLGTSKGIMFCILSLFCQNIFAIPAYLALGVSCNKLYKSILKDKRKENIKIEIVRHSIFCILILCILIVSSMIEVYVSSSLARLYIGVI